MKVKGTRQKAFDQIKGQHDRETDWQPASFASSTRLTPEGQVPEATCLHMGSIC
jgi:hypothetical protein